VADGAYLADDAILLYLVRDGDTEAFEVLRKRHQQAARRLARCLVSADQADDVVAAAFNRILNVTLRGGGPTNAFRPYLLTALRRVSYEQLHTERLGMAADPRQQADPGELLIDLLAAGLETSMIVRAFRSMPERWVAVLWHTEIENTNPTELRQILGLAPDEVATLRHRAWDGLRQTYLRVYLADGIRPECQPVVLRLATFVADATPSRDSAMVTEHLSHCDDCRAVCAALTHIDGALRTTVAQVFLGSAAASYLSAEDAAEAGTPTTEAMAGGAIKAEATARRPGTAKDAPRASTDGARRQRVIAQGRRSSRLLVWIAAAAVPVIAIVVVLALTLTGGGTPSTLTAAAPFSAGTHSPAVHPRKSAAGKAQNKIAATDPPTTQAGSTPAATSASPAPTGASPGSRAPAATAALSATVDIRVGGHANTNEVIWTVTDTGSAATGGLTVSFTLPSGTSLLSNQGEGWTCQQTAGGASCEGSAVSPGGQAQGAISIRISRQACNDLVGVSASSGNVSASAQSPEGIDCEDLRQ
jgi:DNA-directed RNA polymerase specialized sigma24 family protein